MFGASERLLYLLEIVDSLLSPASLSSVPHLSISSDDMWLRL